MRKALQLKDVTGSGEVSAIVATLNVIDKDQDVTEQGFFGTQPTRIVQGHQWDHIMLGKGSVTDSDGKVAHFEGKLNLEDQVAEQLHAKLRFDMEHPPPMIEWSYGFGIREGGAKSGTFNGQGVRILRGLEDGSPGAEVYEVSPVLLGAGEGTRTLDVKGMRFVDELSSVKGSIEAALARASAIAGLRKEQDRDLSEESMQLLESVAGSLGDLAEQVGQLVSPPKGTEQDPPVEEEEEIETDPETLGRAGTLLQAQFEQLTRS